MQPSRRGQVDPFIVMDVMESAGAAEEAGHTPEIAEGLDRLQAFMAAR